MHPKSEFHLKRELVKAGRRCYENEFLSSFDGNLSTKAANGRILITSSGKNKGWLGPDDIATIDEIGSPLSMGKRPSTEVSLHTLVYQKRSDVGAIIHAHPVYAVLISLAEARQNPIIEDSLFFPRPVAITRYAVPTTSDLPRSIMEVVGESNIIILARHGTLTLGKDLAEAFANLVYLEKCSKQKYLSLARSP